MGIIFGAASVANTWQNPSRAGYGKPIIAYQSVVYSAGLGSNISSVTITNSLQNLWSIDTASVFYEQVGNKYIEISNSGNDVINYLALAACKIPGLVRVTAQIKWRSGDLAFYPVTDWQVPTGTSVLFLFEQNHLDPGNPSNWLVCDAPKLRLEFGTMSYATIGHLRMGKYLRLHRGIFVGSTPSNFVTHSNATTAMSESGAYLGTYVTRRWRRAKITQENVDESQIVQDILPFIKHLNGDIAFEVVAQHSFFYSARPEQSQGTLAGENLIYCWPKGTIEPTYTNSNKYMAWSLDVEGIL